MSGQVQIKGNLLASGGGVVAGNNGNTVVEIQGIPIATTSPTDGQVLTYVVADLEWKPETPIAGVSWSYTSTSATGSLSASYSLVEATGCLLYTSPSPR